ncbi:MAG TPA: BamA/TamA family outer membrane protein [Geobacteraceae bacterium]
MRRLLHLLTCCLLLCLTACTTTVPRERLFYPLATELTGEQAKLVTIPLPVIASSPNEGLTAGALTAFLLHNKQDEITTLLAPQVNHNENFGITFSLYGAFYPTPTQNWEFNLSKSSKVNDDYELKIRDASLWDGKLELNGFAYSFTDGSARFFGFQQSSPVTNETNYGDHEDGFTASAGFQIGKYLQLVVGERLRVVDIRQGAINSVPFIRDVYTPANVPGLDGFTAHAQKIALVYSTLDSLTMPTYGGYTRLSFENSAKLLGSSADYRHYEAELKGYVPADDERRFITAFRLMYNQTLGSGVPFLEQSILGGETTLRGYGRNRFIDNSFLLFNMEERIRLFRWEVFDVTADWELAPFMDFGSVMEALDRADSRSFEFNPGVGVRAVVRPNIIGRVDVGLGKEGPAVFVGLGYPF